MASWVSSKEIQLIGTALMSGAVVAGVILSYQHVRKKVEVEDLKSSVPALSKEYQANQVR
jgi:hypothetical protein